MTIVCFLKEARPNTLTLSVLSLAASILIASSASAQDIPRHFTVRDFDPRTPCPAPPPFAERFWQPGDRGPETSLNYLEMICGERFVDYNGTPVRVRWYDGRSRIFTDCREVTNGFRCWVTIPKQ
jgi:hypothetical protein